MAQLTPDLSLLETTAEETALRRSEFSHLNNLCYLDYTGSGVYNQSQINLITEQLKTSIFSHPHGSSVLSQLCVAEIEQVRMRILQQFGTDADEYSLIFTSGATAAIKIVADCFEFNGGSFVYVADDNHTSVLGMREVVRTKNIHSMSLNKATSILNNSQTSTQPVKDRGSTQSLFVYAAQSNFSGTKYPLSWSSNVNKTQILQDHFEPKTSHWFVLLDAATFCSSNQLCLKHYKPDFISVSFYKIFGYPTGLGALIVKNSSAHVLNKSYFGGGTVKIAMASEMFHVKKDVLHEKFEDGTINYLSIISLKHGFDTRDKIARSMTDVSEHVFKLAQYTYMYLKHLYYRNGNPAVELYHDTDYTDPTTQGSIVNFNLLREDGTFYGYSHVQNLANLKNIQLRTGCHCNPGACQRFLRLSHDTLRHHFQMGHVCGDNLDIIEGKPTGSVRISYGYASNWGDVKYFLNFIQHYFLQNVMLRIINSRRMETIPIICTARDTKHTKELVESGSDENQVNSSEYYNNETDTIDSTQTQILEKIFLYPVKACRFYQVERKWEINSSGLKYDRQWMIVNQSGVPLTQKLETQLCFVQPDLDLTRNVLILSFKDSTHTVEVSLDMNGEEKYLNICKSKVCNDKIIGHDCGDQVADWLDARLNRTGLRLIRLKQRTGKQNLTSFSNMGQYLLITRPSIENQLSELRTKFNAQFETNSFIHRFRSNFVISGEFSANDENSWSKVFIKTNEQNVLNFLVKGPCARCQYIYVDQETSQVTDVPLAITKFGIYINNNFTAEDSQPMYVSVGDSVYVQRN